MATGVVATGAVSEEALVVVGLEVAMVAQTAAVEKEVVMAVVQGEVVQEAVTVAEKEVWVVNRVVEEKAEAKAEVMAAAWPAGLVADPGELVAAMAAKKAAVGAGEEMAEAREAGIMVDNKAVEAIAVDEEMAVEEMAVEEMAVEEMAVDVMVLQPAVEQGAHLDQRMAAVVLARQPR